MHTVIRSGKRQSAAVQVHTSAAVEGIIRRINGEISSVDNQIAAALIGGTGGIVQSHGLDALGTVLGLIAVAFLHAAPAATAGGRTGTGVGVTLIGVNVYVAAVQSKVLLCLDTVTSLCCNVHCTAGDGDIALVRIRTGRFDTVSGGGGEFQIQCGKVRIHRIADPDRVLAMQAIIHSIDCKGTVPDLEIVLADNAVLAVAVDD